MELPGWEQKTRHQKREEFEQKNVFEGMDVDCDDLCDAFEMGFIQGVKAAIEKDCTNPIISRLNERF